MDLNDDQLLRYSRQIMLPQVDYEGQKRLGQSRVLIVGLGGLGSPVAMYLAAAGIGHLVLVDDDVVELSNLQRQILHTTEDLQRTKTDSARDSIGQLNPDIKITTFSERLSLSSLIEQAAKADVVVDCCDNFATRFQINNACYQTQTALVSGAAIRMKGQIAIFRPGNITSPCYRCLFSDEEEQAESCSESGVFTPLVGIIGSFQAAETMKLILAIGPESTGRLLTLDLASSTWREIKIRKDPHCPVCQNSPAQEGIAP